MTQPETWEGDMEFQKLLESVQNHPPPISGSKATAATKLALRAGKFYKHAVHRVEKFLKTSGPEYRLSALYIIDSICRHSVEKNGKDKDVFVPRFSLNMGTTAELVSQCAVRDREAVRRVVELWKKSVLFPEDITGPFLEMLDSVFGPAAKTTVMKNESGEEIKEVVMSNDEDEREQQQDATKQQMPNSDDVPTPPSQFAQFAQQQQPPPPQQQLIPNWQTPTGTQQAAMAYMSAWTNTSLSPPPPQPQPLLPIQPPPPMLYQIPAGWPQQQPPQAPTQQTMWPTTVNTAPQPQAPQQQQQKKEEVEDDEDYGDELDDEARMRALEMKMNKEQERRQAEEERAKRDKEEEEARLKGEEFFREIESQATFQQLTTPPPTVTPTTTAATAAAANKSLLDSRMNPARMALLANKDDSSPSAAATAPQPSPHQPPQSRKWASQSAATTTAAAGTVVPEGYVKVPTTTLWIGNISTPEAMGGLLEAFQKHGTVTNFKPIPDKTMAFITYETRFEAEKAKAFMSKTPIAGVLVRIGWGRGTLPDQYFDKNTGEAIMPANEVPTHQPSSQQQQQQYHKRDQREQRWPSANNSNAAFNGMAPMGGVGGGYPPQPDYMAPVLSSTSPHQQAPQQQQQQQAVAYDAWSTSGWDTQSMDPYKRYAPPPTDNINNPPPYKRQQFPPSAF